MFIPIGDYPNPTTKPVVTWSLIALNVVVFVLVSLPLTTSLTQEDVNDPQVVETLNEMWNAFQQRSTQASIDQRAWLSSLTRYDLFVFEYGYIPGMPDLLDLLFCMFLHGGFLHLAGNMLFLWIYGDNVEAKLGPYWYLLAYLGTGVVATLAFALLNRDSMTPLVGASGAISGVLGFYLIWFPRNYVKVFVWFGYLFADTIHIPAVFVLLFYVIVDNLLPLLAGGGASSVAYGAHLGGFLAGAAIALLVGRNDAGSIRPQVRVVRRR